MNKSGILRLFALLLTLAVAACGVRPSPEFRSEAPPPAKPAEPKKQTAGRVEKVTIARGDTVYSVARRTGARPADIIAANNLAAPYALRAGDVIDVPAGNVDRATVRQLAQAARARVPAAPTGAPAARAGSLFSWPASGPVISTFGSKSGGLRNDGINIRLPFGSPVKAADNGVVAYAGRQLEGYGQIILLRHAGGWVTAYAHNSVLLVGRGDAVVKGQVIARSGGSGNVREPQLHFQVRQRTQAVDPLAYLERRG